ncbi:CRISPR-associated helicase, Cas3 family [Actinopolyspora xinjiangensis]|uniref:CRISPR-associated helicase, Cas3 family n=1 Tax=Actinopolyspora xinjiangensis TaxID=405564 RepID=A0A1H0X1I9_9ACTN|nr:CRISPR-associated helicase/endonuclease Cas3 [Actinopolyspora xinjiangensis]SDP96782.1 CRISPR-associated helicase, Cas3 family [Actinopolyspora xinjiangensis]
MYAHSVNINGDRHGFSEHARATAELAARFAEPFGYSELAYALGLFHDCGKARCAWQEKLLRVEGTDEPVGVPHKDLGAHLLKPAAGVAAMAIHGHHGGLSNREELKELDPEDGDLTDEPVKRFLEALPEAKEFLDLPVNSLLPPEWAGSRLLAELGMRLVFSALVDADHLDTSAHFDGLEAPRVSPDTDMSALRDTFERARQKRIADSEDSPINRVREEVYRTAVSHAMGPTDIYGMPAPTGIGKTLTSAGFGLHHAAAHGKKRVIVTVPFTTVTAQNAAEYREMLGAENVLEHHSAVRMPEEGRQALQYRHATENWDSPFIVTTTVQLFDSLFSRKPARMRKLHRLADSVIILDEVQALPLPVLTPILDALRTLSEHFGTTVLLASATLPSFQTLDVWRDLKVPEIVDAPAELFKRMRRVNYEWWLDPRPTLSEVADHAAEHEQVLLVVNTTDDARRIYQHWEESGLENIVHLSNRMCGAHLKAELDGMRARLASGEPVRVVSTQLIEAGVDIDSPVVYRAMAPADSLQQAAGRANRENKGAEFGRVIIFDASDMSQPAGYRIGSDITRQYFGPQSDGSVIDPDNMEVLDSYYQVLYRRSNTENAERATAVQANRSKLDFQAVAEGPLRPSPAGGQAREPSLAFRMLDDDTVPVVAIKYDPEAEQRLNRLLSEPERSGPLLRELQPYVVSLPRRLLQDPGIQALCKPVLGDLHVWDHEYHPAYGIDTSTLIERTVF